MVEEVHYEDSEMSLEEISYREELRTGNRMALLSFAFVFLCVLMISVFYNMDKYFLVAAWVCLLFVHLDNLYVGLTCLAKVKTAIHELKNPKKKNRVVFNDGK